MVYSRSFEMIIFPTHFNTKLLLEQVLHLECIVKWCALPAQADVFLQAEWLNFPHKILSSD